MRALAPVLLLLVLAMSGCCSDATFAITQPPRFTTCAGQPAPRPDYTAGFAELTSQVAAGCGEQGISGCDALYTYSKVGPTKSGDLAFQYFTIDVTERPSCAGPPVKKQGSFLEYFAVPAQDCVSAFFCCRSTWDAMTRGWVAIVNESDLPKEIRAAIPPIPAGRKAVVLNKLLTEEQQLVLQEKI